MIDLVRDLTRMKDVIINEIPFGSRSVFPEKKYFNRRAEMWVRLRDWIRAGGILTNYNECANALRLELCAPMYSFDEARDASSSSQRKTSRNASSAPPTLATPLALTFATDTYPDERGVFPNLERKYGPEAGPRLRDWVTRANARKKEWQPW